jgi:hypothetical protein
MAAKCEAARILFFYREKASNILNRNPVQISAEVSAILTEAFYCLIHYFQKNLVEAHIKIGHNSFLPFPDLI